MLPRRTLSAIAAVLDVARLARSKPLPAKALAARYDLAPRQFETLLQDLVRSGILKSLRGPRGGYELARERRRISLGDIVRAIEAAKHSGKGAAAPGNRLVGSVIEPALAGATAAFLAQLDSVTVEDLCGQAGGFDGQDDADFHI